MLGREPTLIIQAVIAALNGVQIAAISLSTQAHTIIAVVLVALGAVVNRAVVVPAKKR